MCEWKSSFFPKDDEVTHTSNEGTVHESLIEMDECPYTLQPPYEVMEMDR